MRKVTTKDLIAWTKENKYAPNDQCAMQSVGEVKRLIAAYRKLERRVKALERRPGVNDAL